MKLLLVTLLLFQSPNGDRERGLELYRKGQYVEAQQAFARAAEAAPESAELQWNLALAAWRAGDLTTAETAAEKYAALDPDSRPELHRGLLGAVRYAEAERLSAEAEAARAGQPPMPGDEPVDPLPLYEKALQQAFQAKNQFVRGARANPTPELLRNTERSLRKVDELKQRIEELMQERQQQQQGEPQEQDPQQGEQQPSEQQPSERQPGESPPQDPQQQQQQQPPDPQPGEPQPGDPQPGEPQPGEQQPGEQQPGESNPGEPQGSPPAGSELEPTEPRSDAPGEGAEGLELTPEQAQRLLERLRELDEKLKQARARSRGGRRPVERDW